MRLPHTTPSVWPEVKQEKLAARIRRDTPNASRIALLGLPDDTGVRLNEGRVGAAAGPSAFRAQLSRFGASHDRLSGASLDVGVFDAGDLQPAPGTDAAALFETHARIAAAVLELHRAGLLPVCIGGGHDLSLPSITALALHAKRPVGGLNVDAHLDVRQQVGSGMPFRRLIEDQRLDPLRFVELGLGRFANDQADLDWLTQQGATLVGIESVLDGQHTPENALRIALAAGAPAFVSLDLDALDAGVAPGVSAPNPFGLSVSHLAAIAEAAGAEAGVRHFDIMELNPLHDINGHTARVAAFLFLSFLAGATRRPR